MSDPHAEACRDDGEAGEARSESVLVNRLLTRGFFGEDGQRQRGWFALVQVQSLFDPLRQWAGIHLVERAYIYL